jgi:hypothetical protein
MKNTFLGVMVVPTGLGAEIGGHAGDATPAARLLAEACDQLVVHPNVVNASDINEMTDSMLYVEGSMLDRFLRGEVGLQRVRSNRILVAVNPPVSPDQVNAVSAARATLGIDAYIVELETPLRMVATMYDSRASGEVYGWEELCDQVAGYAFDALAILSHIEVDKDVARSYLEEGGTNPWGGVEARLSKLVSQRLGRPMAHAPIDNGTLADFHEVVDPRMAAELVSVAYTHCVLKGLHRAPRIMDRDHITPRLPGAIPVSALWRHDVDVLVTPNCWGAPHVACHMGSPIPMIVVEENEVLASGARPDGGDWIYRVANYHEAAGVILGMRAGISRESVRRPLPATQVLREVRHERSQASHAGAGRSAPGGLQDAQGP